MSVQVMMRWERKNRKKREGEREDRLGRSLMGGWVNNPRVRRTVRRKRRTKDKKKEVGGS
jgi:hypothetical protein